jgi:hypothetical protein
MWLKTFFNKEYILFIMGIHRHGQQLSYVTLGEQIQSK